MLIGTRHNGHVGLINTYPPRRGLFDIGPVHPVLIGKRLGFDIQGFTSVVVPSYFYRFKDNREGPAALVAQTIFLMGRWVLVERIGEHLDEVAIAIRAVRNHDFSVLVFRKSRTHPR
jgi:hypothetical protein